MIMKQLCLVLLSLLVVGYAYAAEKQDQQKIQEFQEKHTFEVGEKKAPYSCQACRTYILTKQFVPRESEESKEIEKKTDKLTYISL
jgi:hypothetical protein